MVVGRWTRFRTSLFAGPFVALAIGLLAACSHGNKGGLEYETKFVGVEDGLKATVSGASQLVALEDKPPDSESALQRRADSDLARLKQVMDAIGYYDSSVVVSVDPATDKKSYVATVTIEPGAQYDLTEVKLVQPDGNAPPELARFLPAAFGLQLNQPALSSNVVAAEPKIAQAYAQRGWPFAKVTDRQVIIDTATKTMHVTYTLDTGKHARFGKVAISGLDWLNEAYVARRVRWQVGMPYDQGQVDATRQTLVTSGLFGAVTIAPSGPVDASGVVPMEIKIAERPLHTIAAGGSYDTSLGIQANVSWEDRDLFGNAEDLLVTAKGGQSDSGLTVKFTRPDAFFYQQDFVTSLTVENELEDAFRAVHQQIQAGFTQHFSPTITGGYSIEAEHARIDEKTDYRVYTMAGVPLFLRDDESDDLLNPTRGWRAGIELTPYVGISGAGSYAQTKITASTYRKIDETGDNILALQGIIGASCCASLESIPKDHRLYAGGGGTVRGFGYQKAGPDDQYDNATGGRSLFVISAEWRTMVTQNIQLVPFVDAGSDYPSAFPDLSQKIYVGAGIGVRYFTPIGPIRLDVATPLNPHPQGDSAIQLYVSLGQAF